MFFLIDTEEQALLRGIDNHYHIEMIAQNSAELVEYQAEALRIQHTAAVENFRTMEQVSERQEENNSLLRESNDLLSSVAGGVAQLSAGLDDIAALAGDILGAVRSQTGVIQQGFQQMAHLMLQQQKALVEIATVLSRPYETKALELLNEAQRAMKQGMRCTGRDRDAEFTDASKLLKEVLENPIGSRNYVAWFQVGWLKWKYERNVGEAEDAFYQAARLSAPAADLYHASSLRHQAHMQYLQSKVPLAFEAIQRAMVVLPDDHDLRYDAARYAARTGQVPAAIQLLERCIDQRPQTIITMFSEPDFLS